MLDAGSDRGQRRVERPVRPQLSEEAAAHVRALIMSGALRPGQAVLAESVAEELGISTTPAREGLHALKVEGFLDLIPRRGFHVAELSGNDIRDLFRIQALIAGEIASRAASSGSPDEIGELDALHHDLIAAGKRGDTELVESKNHAFHRQVSLMSRSRKAAWVLRLLSRYVPSAFYGTIPGWLETTMHDHGEILSRIADHDPDGARRAMEAHIEKSGEQLASYFDERATDEPHAVES